MIVPGHDAGTGLLDFKSTLDTPSLQYFESVAPGSAAELAGLQPGDYLLEVACLLLCLHSVHTSDICKHGRIEE